MNLLFITGGYPSKDKPHRGIFNARSVDSLSKEVSVTVCHIRFWKPGRNMFEINSSESIKHIVFSLPFIPGNSPFFTFLQVRMWSFLVFRLLMKRGLIKDYDLIHSVSMEMAPIGSYISKKSGVKHFTQATGSDVYYYIPKWEPYWNNKTHWHNGVISVVCNSQAIKNELARIYPYLNTDLCYRGVNLNTFPFAKRQTAGPVRFLFIGGLDLRNVDGKSTDLKGGRFLTDIWKELNSSLEGNAELLIAGPGSDGEFGQNWLESLEFPNRVSLLGNLNPDDIPDIMASSHVLLLPSKSEGLPNVVMEAMASGLLVISNEVGGVPELIEDGFNGFLLKPQDKKRWKETIKEVATAFSSYEDFSSRSLKRIEETFNSSSYGNRLIDIYNRRH